MVRDGSASAPLSTRCVPVGVRPNVEPEGSEVSTADGVLAAAAALFAGLPLPPAGGLLFSSQCDEFPFAASSIADVVPLCAGLLMSAELLYKLRYVALLPSTPDYCSTGSRKGRVVKSINQPSNSWSHDLEGRELILRVYVHRRSDQDVTAVGSKNTCRAR